MDKINVAYICYWGIEDGLTVTTVLPHIDILSSYSNLCVHLFTIERKSSFLPKTNEGFKHFPVFSKSTKGIFKVWKLFQKEHTKISYTFLICRSSLSGIVGYLAYKKFGIDFYVESFEPHRYYMQSAGEWKKWGVKSTVLKYFENKQKKYAKRLFTVSTNYQNHLTSLESIKHERVKTMPCAVNHDIFYYDQQTQKKIRKKLNIHKNSICGIYVGKFGGLYYDDSAFEILKKVNLFFDDFFIIILSPQKKDYIQNKLISEGFDKNSFYIDAVPNKEVKKYLSAADFAFNFMKSNEAMKFVNPIKNGEYWACGLPILISQNIGDDSAIIKKYGGGSVFENIDDLNENLKELQCKYLSKPREEYYSEIRNISLTYRNFETSKLLYQEIVNSYLKD